MAGESERRPIERSGSLRQEIPGQALLIELLLRSCLPRRLLRPRGFFVPGTCPLGNRSAAGRGYDERVYRNRNCIEGMTTDREPENLEQLLDKLYGIGCKGGDGRGGL